MTLKKGGGGYLRRCTESIVGVLSTKLKRRRYSKRSDYLNIYVLLVVCTSEYLMKGYLFGKKYTVKLH